MMKIGKSIFIEEKCQGELSVDMTVKLIARLAEAQKVTLPARASILEAISLAKLCMGIDYNRRLTMTFLLFTPMITDIQISDFHFRSCCASFDIPRCSWFFDTCKKFKRKHRIK